ncbi:cytochrome c oxidase subunit II [Cognatilysobacter bugurensis]|uniref:cytochrome-c oxidase n=1 Tax=Cognatilysobacter bugurensis TaxID=543356 RepID=A0A918T217_9GAMM|nr:cytochrome c oxidase subunit II [Lysobacter bugurensis]GHA79226.1 hypothetical protein GCM10007067_15870 [Lysobacter bugurensis]
MRMAPARPIARLRTLCMLAGLAPATGCSGVQSMLDPAGPAAERIAHVWWWMAGGATFVLGLVLALLAWALLRPRHRLAPERGMRLIVAGGIVLPVTLLFVLLVFGTRIGHAVKTLGGRPAHVVEVEGRQWAWTFGYLDAQGRVVATTADRLVMPLGRVVEFRIRSRDVIHSFWIPRLGGKVDAIPGHTTWLRLRADRIGPIRGQCAEFCGLRHAHMAFDVDVMPASAFDRWLVEQGDAPGSGIEAQVP